MRTRTAGRTIPQTQPGRSNWVPVGKNAGQAERKRWEAAKQETRRRAAPGKDADRRGAGRAETGG